MVSGSSGYRDIDLGDQVHIDEIVETEIIVKPIVRVKYLMFRGEHTDGVIYAAISPNGCQLCVNIDGGNETWFLDAAHLFNSLFVESSRTKRLQQACPSTRVKTTE
jgi:hypothetical protein